DAGGPLRTDAGVKVGRRGKQIQYRDGDRADAELDRRVDLERMERSRNEAGEGEAAETHSAHEGAQQHRERNRGRADDQLEQLKPDDLVDERGETAADEEAKNDRIECSGGCVVRSPLAVIHR